jgi:SanA protein
LLPQWGFQPSYAAARVPDSRDRLLLLTAAVSLLVATCNVVVLASGRSTTANTELAPRADAALILGSEVKPGGRPSAMLADRIRAAAQLQRAGRVGRILVTSDEGLRGQVSVMARELRRLGVPEHALLLDGFGIDTWDSVLRARDAYRVRSVIAVTQHFHLPRTLWLADRAGLRATGLEADRTNYGRDGWHVQGREVLARVKAVGDVILGTGPQVDNRRSCSPRPETMTSVTASGSRRPHGATSTSLEG